MAVSSEIVSIGQDLDLDTQDVIHRITLRFPDGTTMQAIITPAGAEHVITQMALEKHGGRPSSDTVHFTPTSDTRVTPEGNVEFGGDPYARAPSGDRTTVDRGELVGGVDVDEDGVGSL